MGVDEPTNQAWRELDRKYTEYNLAPEVREWLDAPDRKWRLLLQLDSDYNGSSENFSFVASGRLYIMIRDIDLRAGRFSNVHFIVQHT